MHSRGSLNLCGILSRLSLSARLQSGKDNLLGSCLYFTLDSVHPFFLLLFGHYVVSDSLWPHELWHSRLPCPSLSPGVCSNSCPLSQRCHPAISSSVVPFSSCLQSFPASVFSSEWVLCIRWPKSWSFSFSTSPPSEYLRLISFRIDWFDLLAVQGTLKSLLYTTSTTVWKHQFLSAHSSLWSTSSSVVILICPRKKL